MKLQPTAHETLQLSVNSQQVTKGLFTMTMGDWAKSTGVIMQRVVAKLSALGRSRRSVAELGLGRATK